MSIKLILASAAAILTACASSPQAQATQGLARIEHIVVIYAENRSFDHLYGLFPGADGIASATLAQKTQLDHDGNRSEEHTSELQSRGHLVCRLLLEKKK